MYPNFKNYDEYNHYVLSYASNQDVAELEKKIDDVQKEQEGQSDIPLVDGKIPASYLPSNLVTVGKDGVIPSSMLPSYVDDVVEVTALPSTGESGKIYILVKGETATQYRWTGTQFVEITSGGVVVGTTTGTAYDGGKGTELETKVANLEATVSDKLGVGDVAVWAKSENPTLIPSDKLDDHAVKYSDFSYVPGGEAEPVARKTIQLANYDSISGLNTEGNDAANLIMMSKWDKIDIGSSRYPVNLNGSEFTLNDNRDIAKVYETKALTNLTEGAADSAIRAAIGLDFEDFVEIVKDENVIIVDRTSIGDYKACIHAAGNISSGNGAVNLMFFIGTKPTIYQIQYVSGTYALAVMSYEFAEKSDIPDTSNLVPAARTVAGKSLESDVVLYAVDIKEKDGSTNTVYDQMPKVISCPMDSRAVKDSYTVAEILAMFGGSTTMAEARVFANRGINYFDMSNNIGSYQKYTIPVNYYNIPNDETTTGTITLIGVGPDPHNKDLITKFTITMSLNGDASTITIDTKALEN